MRGYVIATEASAPQRQSRSVLRSNRLIVAVNLASRRAQFSIDIRSLSAFLTAHHAMRARMKMYFPANRRNKLGLKAQKSTAIPQNTGKNMSNRPTTNRNSSESGNTTGFL